MSQAILKKCLEIVEEDLPQIKEKKVKQKKLPQKKSSIFDMIPESKRLLVKSKTGNYFKLCTCRSIALV